MVEKAQQSRQPAHTFINRQQDGSSKHKLGREHLVGQDWETSRSVPTDTSSSKTPFPPPTNVPTTFLNCHHLGTTYLKYMSVWGTFYSDHYTWYTTWNVFKDKDVTALKVPLLLLQGNTVSQHIFIYIHIFINENGNRISTKLSLTPALNNSLHR